MNVLVAVSVSTVCTQDAAQPHVNSPSYYFIQIIINKLSFSIFEQFLIRKLTRVTSMCHICDETEHEHVNKSNERHPERLAGPTCAEVHDKNLSSYVNAAVFSRICQQNRTFGGST